MARPWTFARPPRRACQFSTSTVPIVTRTAALMQPINASPVSRPPVTGSPASGAQVATVLLSNNTYYPYEPLAKIPRHRPVLTHGHLGTLHPSGIHRSHDLLHSRLA